MRRHRLRLHDHGPLPPDPGPLWPLPDPPRDGGHATVHAGGHRRHRQGHQRPAAAGDRGPHGARQHLPSPPPAGGGGGGRSRRPAPLHGLGRSAAHRLGRLPGVQPRGHQPDRRRRGRLPLTPRRVPHRPDPRALHGHPGGAGGRCGHGLRPVPPLPRQRGHGGRGLPAHPSLAGALRRLPRRRRAGAVRDRAGRLLPPSARRIGPDRGGDGPARHRRGGGERGRAGRGDAPGDTGGGPAAAGGVVPTI